MKRATLLAVVACAGPRYLGEEVPTACGAGQVERCAAWMAERDLDGELDVYDDPALRGYVQRVVDRLARGSKLARAPRVVVSDHDGTYAAFGDRIVIGRVAIERLGSEAELAGVLAHELAHVEGHHALVSLYGPELDDERWLAARRDAEAIADERAVALLERAGYAPDAVARALAAELVADDDEHPPVADRVDRVAALAGPHRGGFEGRRELLAHVDRMIVGRDSRLGARVDDAWVVALLGVAIDLARGDTVHSAGDVLAVRRGKGALTAYAVGAAFARELADGLADAAVLDSALGRVTVGVAIAEPADDRPLAKLARAVRAMLPHPSPGTRVVVLERPRGALVVEIAARTPAVQRDRWLGSIRAAGEVELAAAEPPRIAVTTAARTAPLRALVAACPSPSRAAALDDPARVVAAGELFKCTDR